MNDPLGIISSSAGSTLSAQRKGQEAADPSQPSFKSLVLDQLREVNRLQEEATQAVEDLSTGKRDDFENVMVATRKADIAFQMLLQVRNKVVDAYNEVKQIHV